jgi:methylated-DNA-[protein]-cysteine S-methyltransferase
MGQISLLEMGLVSAHVCAMSGPTATIVMQSPLGPILLAAQGEALIGVKIGAVNNAGESHHPVLEQAITQLNQWFDGRRHDFDLPLAPLDTAEGTALRAGIAAIPYGETRTYGAVAQQAGSIARAVGGACKTNALPIIIPCHRVISANGPEFYSAGDGPRTKGWLLDFEASNLPPEKRTRLL